ncbi:chemotaxis response regulator protein-glutamate methylesterase [Pseudogulbenkiania sp. MAI-1]|uniref:chemotaxis response regulator protein-glutamate methylesterase n=1 Tax=Pseudogulbenkiania sp. MAI-1 TaxID=990370 RepID=UPI00045EB85A|nr:chemotaxis response regulator protein-glutamate methylesterase [Pseudogulbenkiania sp. MAI-1]
MRIGIANDMPMAVEALRRAVLAHPEHQVAWVAMDGAHAVEMCARDTPDLVLMDLIMPGMDGVEATRRIMAESPCAILIVTVNVGTNAWQVFEAMGHGALDAIDTPMLGMGNSHNSARPLLAKIAAIDKLLRERNTPADGTLFGSPPPARRPPPTRLLAIGASAGGPAALATVLGGLPRDFDAAVVIVQHVDEPFAASMATWLAQHSALPVRLAREGDQLAGGVVWLAGTNDHLVLKDSHRLGYTAEPADYVYRPSVDVFFHSVSRLWEGETVGVLLTGMGRDGAEGLKALRDQGCHTIAQDQASSAVYGMPKAAAALQAAVEILPVDRIAAKVVGAFSGKA